MKHPFKEFLFFSRGERRGILLLMAAIVGVVLLGMFREEKGKTVVATEKVVGDSIINKERAHNARTRVAAELFPFDPNTVDSATFRRLGLPSFLARNIIKYREAGGRFRRPGDFRKLYGLREEQYRRLLPYMTLPEEEEEIAVKERWEKREIPRLYLPAIQKDSLALAANGGDSIVGDTLGQARYYKYAAGTVIDLNRADTTELKKIPGIGSQIARMIVTRREWLGGYYAIEQLGEIQLVYELLRPWFRIDTTAVRRIPVNRAGIERLRRHPYINFYQAKVLIEYRRKEGEIRSLKPFVLYEEFTPEDLERIGHYLSFE